MQLEQQRHFPYERLTLVVSAVLPLLLQCVLRHYWLVVTLNVVQQQHYSVLPRFYVLDSQPLVQLGALRLLYFPLLSHVGPYPNILYLLCYTMFSLVQLRS
jgi:hypothetical protein